MNGQFTEWAHAILRISAGALFMQHGLQKLFGLLGGVGPTQSAVPLASQMGLAGILEFGGGLLLMVGLLTRPTAAILCLEMVWAFLQAHLPRGGAPIQNQGELTLLYASVFLHFVAVGPGRFSLDAILGLRFARPT